MTREAPADLSRRKVDRTEGGLMLQSPTLELLLAEMQALAGMMPGVAPSPRSKSDAEIEAAFDNMPV